MSKSSQTVYIFGAGASKHVGGPLMKEFLLNGFTAFCVCLDYQRQALSRDSFLKVAELIDLLCGSRLVSEIDERLNGGPIRSRLFRPQGVTIEGLLTLVDLAAEHGSDSSPFREYRSAIHDFIFETLDHRTWTRYGSVGGGPDNYYDRLVNHLVDSNAPHFPHKSFVILPEFSRCRFSDRRWLAEGRSV